ncbi:MAG: 16S rRNA (cytidine(1402)-2'-O)-methyltransferase [Muribaculaceae bacterium]|nr:16S rRNA (cytidine(1402)-2'-O)-methyltransferase [Muribaculaceae bacterium]
MSGTMYMVPTPVGNLSDMTPRAIEVLRQCSLVLAEDTRTSSTVMRHFGIDTPMMSHHKFNEHATLRPIIDRLLAGEDIALVSDAGTPGISDPGFLLSRECRRNDIPVVTLPGATAFVPALVSSGLPCDRFTFEGFLPPKKGRATRLAELAQEPRTMVIYESPLRLVKTLKELAQYMGGDRLASVSREISKLHETTVRGTIDDLISHFTENNPRGEIVIILSGLSVETERRIHVNKYKDRNES